MLAVAIILHSSILFIEKEVSSSFITDASLLKIVYL